MPLIWSKSFYSSGSHFLCHRRGRLDKSIFFKSSYYISFLSPSAHITSIVPAGFGVSAFQPGHSQRYQEWQHPVGNGWLGQAKWVGVMILLCGTLSPTGWYLYNTSYKTHQRVFIYFLGYAGSLYYSDLYRVSFYTFSQKFTECPPCARFSDGQWGILLPVFK